MEVVVTCKDGSKRPVECCLGFAGENDIVVFTDLTDRIAREREQQRHERSIRSLLEMAPVPMLAIESDGRVSAVNESFTELFGYRGDEIPDLDTWSELVYPDPEYRKQMLRLWKRVQTTDTEKRPSVTRSIESVVRSRDGDSLSVELSLALFGDRSILVLTDVTAHKRYEEQIRQQAQRLNLHMLNTPLGVIEWDMDFRVTRWNSAAERIFGYREEEAIGMEGGRILPELARRAVATEIWEKLVCQEGGTLSVNENLRKDGTELTCEWYNTPLIDEKGKVFGVASLVLDVSERVHREQELREAKEAAEKANRAKSEFLSVMSHELRTPLNSIIGPCQLLRAQLTDQSNRGLIDIILSSSSHLLDLINSILDLAKIESGGVVPKRQRVDLEPFLRSRLTPLRETALKKGLEFDLVIDLPPGAAIESDPLMLLQILFNLIGNATKFTDEGRVSVEATAGEDESLLLRVRDTGVGIAERDLLRLFEPFQQVESSCRRQEGSGLGLAITKKLTMKLGGEIEAWSELGRGSAFTVWLPGLMVDEVVALDVLGGASTRRTSVEPERERGERILLIEDEPNNQLVCSALLRHLKREHVVVGSGEEAIERYVEEPFPIVLVDIKLPGIDGIETCRRLRAAAGDRPIYLIAQTAYALGEQKEYYLHRGMDDYLSKPLSVDGLRKALQRAEESLAGR